MQRVPDSLPGLPSRLRRTVDGHRDRKLRRWHRWQIAGYWAFGYDVGDNILQTVGKPKWLIVMANLMVVRTQGRMGVEPKKLIASSSRQSILARSPCSQHQEDCHLQSLLGGPRKRAERRLML